MATLTSNISNVSLTVSGTTQNSTTISWSLPTVPSGATINSCTLTGTATASMSKGSATITVNGQSVSSGSNFTINLGTANTTSSVTATAKGGNKNAAGTVTFSNLVYTVNYTEPEITYTVTFVDYDGTILKTQTVSSGSSATAPEINRYGYILTGWSVDFSNVTSNITTVAQYAIVNVLSVKENGEWTNIREIYKKISGVWVKQENSNWLNLFDNSIKYKRISGPTVILYSDGYLVFKDNDIIDTSHGEVIVQSSDWLNTGANAANCPWYDYKSNIVNVYVDSVARPASYLSWFYNCYNLQSFSINNIDTSNVTNMYAMFYNCSSLTSLDVSSFNTSNVTNMYAMFSSCSSLTSLDVSSFDTSNVTNMYSMFYNCPNLTSLDLSNFDTSNVINMTAMFQICNSLTSLDISDFDMSNVADTTKMFYGCSNLQTIYVKDETAKIKIESGADFPTTATVIIGKPT